MRRIALLAVLIAAIFYAFWPRTANLRDFSPEAAARQEALAWRHYYEQRYLPLGADLYKLCRQQTGASPARSLQIIYHAARAAQIFQHSQSRETAAAALPDLQRYYRGVARASGMPFDVEQAAKLELEWWQQRREHLPPEVYAQTIAATTAIVYGFSNIDTEQAALLRAQAMAYRDARRNEQITEADWQHIELILREAYQHLLRGINGG